MNLTACPGWCWSGGAPAPDSGLQGQLAPSLYREPASPISQAEIRHPGEAGLSSSARSCTTRRDLIEADVLAAFRPSEKTFDRFNERGLPHGAPRSEARPQARCGASAPSRTALPAARRPQIRVLSGHCPSTPVGRHERRPTGVLTCMAFEPAVAAPWARIEPAIRVSRPPDSARKTAVPTASILWQRDQAVS